MNDLIFYAEDSYNSADDGFGTTQDLGIDGRTTKLLEIWTRTGWVVESYNEPLLMTTTDYGQQMSTSTSKHSAYGFHPSEM